MTILNDVELENLSLDSERWDMGSQSDDMRNLFVVPNLAAILNKFRPATILDVGAATGYVARKTDSMLAYRPTWTLIDRDETRLTYAQNKMPANMRANVLVGDFITANLNHPSFEAVVLCFTLLELQWKPSLFQKIKQMCTADGILVVVLPDVWTDVCAFEEVEKNVAKLFLRSPVEITKIDKFTGAEYPFIAQRLETLLGGLVAQGFSLVGFIESGKDEGSAFMLTFENN